MTETTGIGVARIAARLIRQSPDPNVRSVAASALSQYERWQPTHQHKISKQYFRFIAYAVDERSVPSTRAVILDDQIGNHYVLSEAHFAENIDSFNGPFQ